MIKNNQNISISHWEENNLPVNYAIQYINKSNDTKKLIFSDYFQNNNIFGQFAYINQIDTNTYETARDALGIGKIFYTNNNNEIIFSNNYIDLLKYNNQIYAAPRGLHVEISTSGTRNIIKSITPDPQLSQEIAEKNNYTSINSNDFVQSVFVQKLKLRLNKSFQLIKKFENDGYTIFIALSGGLDSSIIAVLAKEHLNAPIACTLDLGRSEDAEKATRITSQIGIKHIVFSTSEQEILEAVDQSPTLCQDYRDFNVHCTALNILLGINIKQWADNQNIKPDKRIILTGDLMNEFTCDYTEEIVDNTIYYRLPRINTKMLQRHLIGGLDTSDREALPFQHYGLNCIQPYAATYDLYAALPEEILQIENVKQTLNGHLVPPEVIKSLPKSKLRAQVGSKESMGVLGLCHREGINEQYFLNKLLNNNMELKKSIPISMGRYTIENYS